ncbi:hypothetical protein DPMN_083942 [Dreissena polymorpha]|uniref:Uncharacterized protein n=1 Tax=Dreissena polymorpha TaxID=45954 RepID=A0A9D3YAV3_DREPO|nr:hypothetical protein DPMN_083942 [Dreissena polymorpha]
MDSIRFERVHRSPGASTAGRSFRSSKTGKWRESIGRNATLFRMFEMFPQNVIHKRRKLVPKMKDARRKGKHAYLAYDTL